MISEKPSAARQIAYSLDQYNSPRKIIRGGVSYYECRRDSDIVIVVYTSGHLLGLKQREQGWSYPRMDAEWVPIYALDRRASRARAIINLIQGLSKEIDQIVVATDYDMEGSLIGYLTAVYVCNADPRNTKRMKFSSLTREEILSAYNFASPSLDLSTIRAAIVRHYVDWLYGINMTRALTLALKRVSGNFKILSTGRVQGPALALVASREQAINTFVPSPRWKLLVLGDVCGQEIQLQYNGQIETLDEMLKIIEKLDSSGSIVHVDQRLAHIPPPPPFNLSTLQSEAFRLLGIRPSKTLELAESLYLDALISYPRTDSQQIPTTIDLSEILTDLGRNNAYAPLVQTILGRGGPRLRPGPRTDPAHPAIHPTGKLPSRRLHGLKADVYDLVVRRFLCALDEESVKQMIRADVNIGGLVLSTWSEQLLKRGWQSIYLPGTARENRVLPPLSEGMHVRVLSVMCERLVTHPPARYSPSTLVKALESNGLGTKGTRADIVDCLLLRGYVLDDKYHMSALGHALFEALLEYIPELLSTSLTRALEEKMAEIRINQQNCDAVIREAKDHLLRLLAELKLREQEIGTLLAEALSMCWDDHESFGNCPRCGVGILKLVRSGSKSLVKCSGQSDGTCDLTFPMPRRGHIIPTGRVCNFCNTPIVQVVSGRRTWETCVGWVQCPGRQIECDNVTEKSPKKRTVKGRNTK